VRAAPAAIPQQQRVDARDPLRGDSAPLEAQRRERGAAVNQSALQARTSLVANGVAVEDEVGEVRVASERRCERHRATHPHIAVTEVQEEEVAVGFHCCCECRYAVVSNKFLCAKSEARLNAGGAQP
jgi:hypothetical protein